MLKKMINIAILSALLPYSAFANSEMINALNVVFEAKNIIEYEKAAHSLSRTIIEQDKEGIEAEVIIQSVSDYVIQKIENGELTEKEVFLTLALIEKVVKSDIQAENLLRVSGSLNDQSKSLATKLSVTMLSFGFIGGFVGWRLGKGSNAYTRFTHSLAKVWYADTPPKIWNVLAAAGISSFLATGAVGTYSVYDVHMNPLEVNTINPDALRQVIEDYDSLIDSK